MRNFIQEGKMLDFTAPAGGVLSGVPLMIGAIVVVPATNAAEGERFAGATEGVFELPAATHASTQAWTEAQLLYWDDVAKKFTITSSGNTKKGIAAAVKASTAATGWVKLIQTL